MKKVFSLIVNIALVAGFLTPVVSANPAQDRKDLLRKRIQIVRQLRKSKGDVARVRELKLRYRDIQNSLKNLSNESHSVSMLSVSPITLSSPRPAPEKQHILRERRMKRLSLRPVQISNASDGLAQHPGDPEVMGVSVERGGASYYADMFDGRLTASGTTFSNVELTAAHRTLPFGTRVRVVNMDNGNTVDVTVTDRGPFVEGRIIDLTSHAFSLLDNLSRGVLEVEMTILE